MAVIEFVQNYDDLSTDQGFQFKFRCNRCGNGYMSTFVPNKFGVANDLLKAAGGLFGGILGNVENAAYNIQRAVGGPAHDAALQSAVAEIKPLFNQCHRCGAWVCGEVCWNAEKGLCKQDAPVLGEEVAAAQAAAMTSQVHSRAMEYDQTQGVDLSQAHSASDSFFQTQPAAVVAPASSTSPTGAAVATCTNCGAAVGSSKFCPECGTPVVHKLTCANCHAELTPGTKFCPECGTKV